MGTRGKSTVYKSHEKFTRRTCGEVSDLVPSGTFHFFGRHPRTAKTSAKAGFPQYWNIIGPKFVPMSLFRQKARGFLCHFQPLVWAKAHECFRLGNSQVGGL